MVLLDSSAWLAHLFGEPGVEEVNRLFDDHKQEVCISALSIPEVYTRLRSLESEAHWPQVWASYTALFTRIMVTDEAIAHRAILLRSASPKRLPTIDGLIAATAAVHGCPLVHRDPHFNAIPPRHLNQIVLPDTA